MGEIKKILMDRDGISACEASNLIDEAKDKLQKYLEIGDQESAFNICEEFFGLEPDLIMELI